MSMSCAMAWVTPKRCTSTSLTRPVIAETVIADGYGLAATAVPPAVVGLVIVMPPVFGKSVGPSAVAVGDSTTTTADKQAIRASTVTLRTRSTVFSPPSLARREPPQVALLGPHSQSWGIIHTGGTDVNRASRPDTAEVFIPSVGLV